MFKIIDGRATGKTTQLVCLAKEFNYTIVSNNPKYVYSICNKLGIQGIEIISYRNFLNNSKYENKKYLIDDCSSFLRTVNSNIVGYSDSKEYFIDEKLTYIREE